MSDDRFEFARERMTAAKGAMMALLGKAMDSYTGTFASADEQICIFDGQESQRLLDFVVESDAELRDETKDIAPYETILIMASMPDEVMESPPAAKAMMNEAIAEVLRVILSQAIIAAKHDCKNGEKVLVSMRSNPQFMAQLDFEKNAMHAMGRMRCAVVCQNEPKANYLLGSILGQPKPFTIAYELPLVDMVYGPNRFRWKDRRAPDSTARIQLVMA